ncbi:MAG TPA: ABC transporter ATP-binding protein [Spirochaeta sp.]|nr:ABC transporter ATP-binding protein [Spirochaeta sp.]
MATLDLESVSRRFGGLKAVDNVDFSLNEGEIVGIIGPNGAGKTTLINLISGITPVSSGTIAFEGEDITDMGPHGRAQLGIGRTYQLIHPVEHLTVEENVMVGFVFAQGMNMKQAREASKQLCAAMGIEKPGRIVSQLNILEVKKMEIAHALSTGPKILFLDEIMAGLNADETHQVIALVQKIASERSLGVGVVEHVMGVIKKLTHRVIVLESGAIIASGEYEDVVKNPQVLEAYLGGGAH